MRKRKLEKKYIITLKEEEILAVQTYKKKSTCVVIKCINGNILINELPIKKIENIKIEKKQTAILKKITEKKQTDNLKNK